MESIGEIVTTRMVLHLGDRERRGHYWNGYDWCPLLESTWLLLEWLVWVTTLPPWRNHLLPPPPIHHPRVPAHPP
ncbi:MAG: hypothetical protein GPOALKHO_000612 [Sodalis sp.]|nr:MAG: hypothetical protein GPOALKHO_000612 [Sodalis sp.]